MHGSSLFHHLPNPRSCRSLRIPFEYCTCQFEKVSVVGPQEFISGIGEFMVSWLNKEIEKNNATKKCEVLNLDTRKEVKVQEFEPKSRLNIYQVTVKVSITISLNFASRKACTPSTRRQEKCAHLSRVISRRYDFAWL